MQKKFPINCISFFLVPLNWLLFHLVFVWLSHIRLRTKRRRCHKKYTNTHKIVHKFTNYFCFLLICIRMFLILFFDLKIQWITRNSRIIYQRIGHVKRNNSLFSVSLHLDSFYSLASTMREGPQANSDTKILNKNLTVVCFSCFIFL